MSADRLIKGSKVTYIYQIITPGLSCFILTIILVHISIKLAPFIGALDYPGALKIHSDPTPRVGGMAIFLSVFFISLLFSSAISNIHNVAKVLISLSVIGIFLLGVIDDIKNLNANVKVIFQILNVLLAAIGLFTLYNSSPIVFYLIIFFFMLGYTNAFNLIDGMDGLASGLAIFIAIGLLIISLVSSQQFTVLGTTLIIGASLGFLFFNLNPAKIFLGDSGSTFLGFSLGILISMIWLDSDNKLVFFPLLIIAGIPLFDTCLTIIRRLIKGQSLFTGDRNHLYDLMLQKGFTVKQTLLFLYILSFFLSASGTMLYILIEFKN